jgi:3',5'-cyclic AMP phosphodiesterase CpdA
MKEFDMVGEKTSASRSLSKWKTLPFLFFLVLLCLSAGFGLLSIIYGAKSEHVTPPPLLGNKPDRLARLSEDDTVGRPFSFLVAGDTRSSDTFEDFMNDMSIEHIPDFGIILGDFVPKPEMQRHRFFIQEFTEWHMRFPILLVAGNHDIFCHGTTHDPDPFTLNDFEKTYGPVNFSFTHGGCLFICLNDLYNGSYVDYARDTLARKAPTSLMIFVFTHIPPRSISPMIKSRPIEREKEFIDLLEQYGVDYVFSGDFHSYFRSDYNHVKFIVSGGGGSKLWGGSERSFHHVLVISVDPRTRDVDETIYPIPEVNDLGDDIEIIMICQLYPFFKPHLALWAAAFSLVIVATLAGIGWLIIAARTRSSKRLNPRKGRG